MAAKKSNSGKKDPTPLRLPDDFHALYDAGLRLSRGITPPASAAARSAGHTRLAAEVQDLDVDYDEATQLPNRIFFRNAAARALTRAEAAGSPEAAVLQFVRDRGDLWHLTPEDLATVEVLSVSRKGLPTVNLIQRVGDREVFNSDATVSVGPGNEVISIAGQFFPGAGAAPGRNRAAATTVATTEEEAIARAAADLTGIVYEASDFTKAETKDSGPYRFYAFGSKPGVERPGFEREIRLKDVLFPMGQGHFVPGYYMELWIQGFPAFSYVMDAVDSPDLLYRKNLTNMAAFKYKVYNTGDAVFRPEDGPAPGSPHPVGSPDGFQAPTIKQKMIEVESLIPGQPCILLMEGFRLTTTW